MIVALQAGTPHEAVQRDVRGGEVPGVDAAEMIGAGVVGDPFAAAQVDDRLAPFVDASVVAADAELVEHRLHFAVEVEPARRPYQGVMSRGARWLASVGRVGGLVLRFSWQPTQETTSPGMAVNQLRMSCRALPSASSGCTAIGVLAGTRNKAEPSASTGTVPRIRLMSHGPSMPTTPCGPPMFG